MSLQGNFCRRWLGAGLICCLWAVTQASAQEIIQVRPAPVSTPHVVVKSATSEDAAAPISPTKSPGPMSLDQCIELGFQHQPALDAARASLNAAYAGARGVERLPIAARLFARDYKIRRTQAGLGITIADAGLQQAIWETRYAITRNFFTMQFIEAQGKVVDEVYDNLVKSQKRAQQLFDSPTPDSKITKVDLDRLEFGLVQVRVKKSQVVNGKDKALAALREAMGLGHDYPLEIAAFDLTDLAVTKVQAPKVDEKGNVVKDKKGNTVIVDEYRPVYSFNKSELIASGVANRGELVQASTALHIAQLEVSAQYRKFGLQSPTFAAAGDVHSKMVPQSMINGEYRPGAFAPEWPTLLVGRRGDRAARASALTDRSAAVVDKAVSLVSLDVEAQYLKWQEAITEVRELSAIQKLARDFPDRVLKLNPGDFTGQAVIDANITAITMRTQLNDALHTHALGLAGLERATAGAFRVFPTPAPK